MTDTTQPWTPEELALIERDEMPSDEFAARLAAQVEASPALLTKDEVFAFEESIRLDAWRRMAMLILTKSGAELCEETAEDRGFSEGVAALYVQLPNIERRYQALLEMLGAAKPRLMCALAMKTDMQDILKAARESIAGAAHEPRTH